MVLILKQVLMFKEIALNFIVNIFYGNELFSNLYSLLIKFIEIMKNFVFVFNIDFHKLPCIHFHYFLLNYQYNSGDIRRNYNLKIFFGFGLFHDKNLKVDNMFYKMVIKINMLFINTVYKTTYYFSSAS